MLCKKCGHEIGADDKICPECSTPVNQKSKGPIIALVIVLIAALGVCGYFFVPKLLNKNNEAEKTTVNYGRVAVVNESGEDAVEIYLKSSDNSEDWGENLLKPEEAFHVGKGREFTYQLNSSGLFDVRLVYANGESEDFLGLDFATANKTGRIVYLGEPNENAPVSTAPAATAKN